MRHGMRRGPTGSCSCVMGSSSTAPGPRPARSPSSTRPQRSEVASEDTPVASGDAADRSGGSLPDIGRFARWWSGWRVAIRIARRDARRYKWRSALIVAMVGLPVLLLTSGITLLATTEISMAESVPYLMGSAQARITERGVGRLAQSPDGRSNSNDSDGEATNALTVPGFAVGSAWTTDKVQK